ncbi:hypothetical protein [Methanomethylovorans sp.]|uniref:hypothetical protein n=1 Tax=Methanomethylovorans sp. TaxID=2758717 RepID=UPI00345EBB1C
MGFDLNDPDIKYKEQALFHMNGPFNDPKGYKGRKDRKKQKDPRMKYVKVLISVVAIPIVFMVLLGSLHEPMQLVHNETAHDPTWDELITFLRKDDTDRQQYQDRVFDCTQFAERLHNNAEQAGIRAAVVTIFWYNNSTGHALNAFETTDKGLTFVDCTGSDSIAYVEKDKNYGTISIYLASDPDYGSFVRYKENKDAAGVFEDTQIIEAVYIYWDYGLAETVGYHLHQRKELGYSLPDSIITLNDYIRNSK